MTATASRTQSDEANQDLAPSSSLVERASLLLSTRYGEVLLAALAFGLEAGDTISRISVRWPDGKEEDLSPQLGADGTIRVLHSSLAAPKQP